MYRCRDCGSIFEEEIALSVKQDYSNFNILACPECECVEIFVYNHLYEDLHYEYENADNDDEREYFKELIKHFEENYKGDRL